MLIFSLIYLILTINICSYAYYRSKFNGRAILKVKKPAKGTQKMTYLLPGFSANPEKSFSFLTEVTLYEKSAIKGGITLVEYRNLGFSPEVIGKQIINDIKRNDYRATIISLSISDQIARYVEQEIKNVSIVTISPITNEDCLKLENEILYQIKLPIVNFFITLLGWLGQLRLVKTEDGKNISISLQNDLENCLINRHLEVGKKATRGLVLSKYDEFLDNNFVRDVFANAKNLDIRQVDTTHANTIIGGILYRNDVIDLLQKIQA
ncbi:hypothetical protein IKF94_01765 [Candidatus Saccharibacteria bacterium]|nr:hypothetical protein [Candidatus Saccharibacteria bacterium]